MKLTSNFAGKNNWRVPTIDELKTLVYCSSGSPKIWSDKGNGDSCDGNYESPTIVSDIFPNTPKSWFWSSSSYNDDENSSYALGASFYDGYSSRDTGFYDKNTSKKNSYYVRLVRK